MMGTLDEALYCVSGLYEPISLDDFGDIVEVLAHNQDNDWVLLLRTILKHQRYKDDDLLLLVFNLMDVAADWCLLSLIQECGSSVSKWRHPNSHESLIAHANECSRSMVLDQLLWMESKDNNFITKKLFSPLTSSIW